MKASSPKDFFDLISDTEKYDLDIGRAFSGELRNLPDGIAVGIEEMENLFLSVGEIFQELIQSPGKRREGRVFVVRDKGEVFFDKFRAASFFSQFAVDHIQCDPVEPGKKFIFWVILFQNLVNVEKDVLGEIRGILVGVKASVGHPVDEITIPVHNLPKGFRMPFQNIIYHHAIIPILHFQIIPCLYPFCQ